MEQASEHGFLLTQTGFSRIDFPGAEWTGPYAINNRGTIVGMYMYPTNSSDSFGFILDGSGFSTVLQPGWRSSSVFGINNHGQIVGSYFDGTAIHGFLGNPPDTTPPKITVSTSPRILWPANGKMLPVTVTGTIRDDQPAGSGVNPSTAVYAVTDEYGEVQPSGNVDLQPDGSYAFMILLQASRRGNGRDGREYTVTITANDFAGNTASAAGIVTVPHSKPDGSEGASYPEDL